MNQTIISRPTIATKGEVYLLEEPYIQYCECKVSKLVDKGHLLRDDDGDLWYSAVKLSYDEIRTYHAESRLTFVDNNLAQELGIGTIHWKGYIVLKELPNVIPADCRIRPIKAVLNEL